MKKSILTSAMALVLTLSACSENKTAEQLIISGNDFVQVRDFASAVIEFKNAVRLEPKNANARFALANVYLAQGNYVFAEKEMEKSQQFGISQAKILPLLAQVKTRLAKPDGVYQLIEASTELNDDDFIIVLTYAGIAALGQDDFDRAKDYIGQAISINETATYSRVGKAYLARTEQEYVQSLTAIENVLKDKPNFSEALLVKGHLLFELADYEQAATSFADYSKQHPMDYSVRFFEVDSLIKAELFEQAEVIVDQLLAKLKTEALPLHYKAQLQYQKSLYKEAKVNAAQSIQAGSNSAVTKLIAGASAYQLKEYEQAYNYLKPIEKFLSNSHPAKKILAVIQLQLGYSAEAVESLTSLEGLTNADSDFLQASIADLIAIGDFENAQKIIEKSEKLDPNNANLTAQKGFVLLSQNNEEGIQLLERAIKLDPSLTDVDLALGLEYLKDGDDAKAKSIADKLISEHSNNATGYVLQGTIYAKGEEVNKAINAFEKALTISPDNVASLFNLGLLLKADDSEAAMNYFKRVIKLAPTHKGALSSYVALANVTNQLAQSLQFLQSIYTSDNVFLSIALAQNLRLSKQTEAAIALLKDVDKNTALNAAYWSLLGDLFLQLRDPNKANIAFSDGLQLEPKHYQLNLRSIGALDILKKYAEALQRTKLAYASYPNNVRLEILLAHFEMKNKNVTAAKEILALLQQKRIKHPEIDSTAGQLAMWDKDFEQAISFFSSAFEQKNNEGNAIQLARALKFSGQQLEAEKVLEDFVGRNVKEIKIRFLLAELYGEESRSKKIVQYQAILDLFPGNILALNNLAWNQYKKGQVTLALATAEEAYKLAPDNVAILETYGVVLASLNQNSNAIRVLEAAISNGSNDVQVKDSLIKAKASLKQ